MNLPRPTQLQGITDLTVIADIKPGLVKGIFDSRSYAWRLKMVLDLLDAARHSTREASLHPNPFADNVGRLRGVQFFRFAILPSGRQMLLNVSFDGGWEPYIRRIWGPLGTLLDLIFCHCERYPLAAASSFDDYVAWIRRREVPGLFFYADSAGTTADRAYLERLETLQRSHGDRADTDLRAAQLALGPPPPTPPSPAAVNSALRNLRGLHGLTRFFGQPGSAANGQVPTDDGSVLLRFAQDFLPELRKWFAQGLFDPGQRFDMLRAPFETERTWLMTRQWSKPRKADLLDPSPAALQQAVQAGILSSPRAPQGRHMRGALVLARVRDAQGARQWLKNGTAAKGGDAAVISDGRVLQLDDKTVVCTVAITWPGLQALGVQPQHLQELPAEFVQGMEARAGLLGDLRGNHPQHWQRPRAGQTGSDTGAKLAPLDLGLVHLVIQLRTAEAEAEAESEGDRAVPLPRLADWIQQLSLEGEVTPEEGFKPTFEVLAVEPGWGRPWSDGELAARDHFGYVDGISQPRLTPSTGMQFWDDTVKKGEVLLGWVNDRGDGPLEAPGDSPKRSSPEWLDNCSFLVLRKIRQHVERFDAVVERAAATLVADGLAPAGEAGRQAARELVRTKLMGRGSDGRTPVVQRGAEPNDFDYRSDADGTQCPFASHVRRANPRQVLEGGIALPRLVRRGMSYGPPPKPRGDPTADPSAERGVLFMAYNASISEQFELIQRWLTGGNSTGVSSSQADPFLGVAQKGEPTVFRCTHGDKVLRIDLGDEAFNSLQWGLYAFVPSMALLRTLDRLTLAAPADDSGTQDLPEAPAPRPWTDEEKEALRQQVKREFEDAARSPEGWKRVRRRTAGVEKVGTTVLVGSFDSVRKVLGDGGGCFSVRGYGQRMEDTLGISPFGQDDLGETPGHERAHVTALKKGIAGAVSEDQAFAAARDIVTTRLQRELQGAQALGLQEASIDVLALGSHLVAQLCAKWFGVAYSADGVTEGGIDAKALKVRCPGHFLVMARKVFSAYPNPLVQDLADLQAPPLREAVAQWVATAEQAQDKAAPVIKAVLDAMRGANLSAGERSSTLGNVMLGLPATLLGSWAKLMVAWSEDRRLWRLQHELAKLHPEGTAITPDIAAPVLRNELIRTMALDPVADGIWRTAATAGTLGDTEVEADDIVWLGLGAALRDRTDDLQATEELLFGGALQPGAAGHAPHACPGRGLAMGALLGALSALLLAGQWSATASPTTLALRPRLK